MSKYVDAVNCINTILVKREPHHLGSLFYCVRQDMRSIPTRFYKSRAWEKCRAAYLASVGGLCERCKAEDKIVPAEIVHHKIYLREENYKDASVALNFDNLEALCQECHNQEHFKEKMQRRWKFENGSLTISQTDPLGQ